MQIQKTHTEKLAEGDDRRIHIPEKVAALIQEI
jgi:hypothetical protein